MYFFIWIPAWIMVKSDFPKMKEDQMYSDGESFTKAGKVFGMISCILSIITLLGLGLLMAIGTVVEL